MRVAPGPRDNTSLYHDRDRAPIGRAPSVRGPQTENSGETAKNRETFLSQMAANRHPPRLPLSDLVFAPANEISISFEQELSQLASRKDAEVAADLAEIFLLHADAVHSEGSTELNEAFDELGEIMRNYEHIRLMRDGELG